MITIDDSLLPPPPGQPPRWHRDSQEKNDVPETTFVNITPPAKQTNWLMLILVGLLAYMAFGGLHCDRVTPGPSPNPIDDKGKYVLVLEDKSEEGQAKLTDEQKASINSVEIADAANTAGFEFRKLDQDAIKLNDKYLTGIEPIWKQLVKESLAAPSLTIANDGKMTTGMMPSIEQAKKAIEDAK